MSRHTQSKEELELNQIRAHEELLLKREREFAANRERIVKDRSERERTMPPLAEVEDRKRRLEHEATASRGAIENHKRAERRSLVMIFLLITATCSLVWWGVQIMNGS